MHEALCRPSGTTLDSVHAERRAADHSANIGSRSPLTPPQQEASRGARMGTTLQEMADCLRLRRQAVEHSCPAAKSTILSRSAR
jgi:hypothetical protein